MGLAQPNQGRMTVDEYLAFERESAERHLYLDGDIFDMAGESGEHGDITTNVVVLLANQLKSTPCRVRSKDTKVRSGLGPASGRATAGMFSYPDILVICGKPDYHDIHRDVVLNPRVIIEVLSPSTEAFDRGGKFKRYQTWNPTLTDYILVSQAEPQVEHFMRQADGRWMYSLHTGLEARVIIESIGCTLQLSEVYDRVSFAEA